MGGGHFPWPHTDTQHRRLPHSGTDLQRKALLSEDEENSSTGCYAGHGKKEEEERLR